MRLPESLLQSVKEKDAKLGIAYQRLIREAIETAMAR
jgi:predicted DNA binding CopG/RHH family protein